MGSRCSRDQRGKDMCLVDISANLGVADPTTEHVDVQLVGRCRLTRLDVHVPACRQRRVVIARRYLRRHTRPAGSQSNLHSVYGA